MKRFAMVFAVLAIAIAAMAQSAIHVCRTDGSIITLADSTIRGMEWVNVDSQGVAHANYVMLVIRTDTDTLRLPLTAIDSISFKPMIETIAVTTVTAPSVAYNGATLAGSVTGIDGQNVTAIGMIYGTMAELSATVGAKAASGSTANGGYTVAVGGLSSGTTYYYRAYVEVDSTAYLYGEVKSFTTAEYESVDLGLSVKWAACNVGTTSPEGNGSLYAWGETSAKDGFTQSNYKYYSSGGYTDIGTDISGTDCDAARANWGDHWRMPTSAEMQELCDSCTWTWIYQNSVAGMKVTGKNGNSIFLPAAGFKMDISFGIQGRVGEYWSGTLSASSDAAIDLLLSKDGSHSWNNNSARYAGLSIRPVRDLEVITDTVTAVYPTGATLVGNVSNVGKFAVTVGMIYGTASSLSATSGTKVAGNSTEGGSYSVDLRTLSASTTYYYRAYALRENEYIYGDVKSFTTPAYETAGEAIDLGLSVKWASCNVGATTPEGFGNYFASGETTSKADYTENTYKYYVNGNYTDIGSDISRTEYDAARANWGSEWRMPTSAEIKELSDSCSWTWTTQNGVKGMKVTAKNGNSIFLPAAGYSSGIFGVSGSGKYWCSTISGTNAFNIDFNPDGSHNGNGNFARYYGLTIRPVHELQVSTDTVTLIYPTGVTLVGSVAGISDAAVSMGMIYGTSADLSAASGTKVASSRTTYGTYTVDLRGLSASTTYYYRAYALRKNIYTYGDVKSFTTPAYDAAGDAIDLGLSVRWANCNVGAASPEGYGGYYGWADPTGTKTSKNLNDYPSANPPSSISGTEYDMARAKWGGIWRLPTKAEQQELIDSCTWTLTTQNGVKGYKVTGKNGNSIFLPAAGYRIGPGMADVGKFCNYWSGTLVDSFPDNACDFNSYSGPLVGNDYRFIGFSVRPVRDLEVTTDTVTAVYTTGATLAGSVAGNSKSTISMGMIYGTSADLSAASGIKVVSSRTTYGTYTVDLRTLSASTTYYYRAYALYENIYTYGDVKSFTTPAYDAAGDAIDLGLSVKWASCNVGAVSPEGYGGYYGWADPSGTKTSTNVDDYPSTNPPSRISGSEYDAARAKWGSTWRMPTQAEQQELIDSCTWTWTTQNGVNGYKVTGKNGNSIFLPAAGLRNGTGMHYVGTGGYCWSGTLNGSDANRAYYSYFGSDYHNVGAYDRSYGFSVRPVFNLISAVTDTAFEITQISVTLTGTVIGTTEPHDTISCGMFYSTQSAGVKSGTKTASNSSGDGTFSLSLNGLIANTTYYYCAYLMIDDRYYYGEVKSFTTKAYEDAVDLGLSVKWASCNVGATKPEEYGGYYGWADPTGTKTSTNFDDYPSANPPSEISGTEYDIARVKWGGNWRLPTTAEVQELVDSCTWTWTTQNGVNGMKVVGPNGNSIFLPAAGFRNGTDMYRVGTYGEYLSGTLNGSDANIAYNLGFNNYGSHGVYDGYRFNGFTVRPVVE